MKVRWWMGAIWVLLMWTLCVFIACSVSGSVESSAHAEGSLDVELLNEGEDESVSFRAFCVEGTVYLVVYVNYDKASSVTPAVRPLGGGFSDAVEGGPISCDQWGE